MCIAAAVFGKPCFLGPPAPLAISCFLPPLSQGSLNSYVGFDGDIPPRNECFNVFAHCLDLSVCPHLLQKATSLVMDDKDTNL